MLGFIRALKRRLGHCASPEGLTPSFRTVEVAEPVLQDTVKNPSPAQFSI